MLQQERKVRIYDLAKELKMESKKVLADAQREGADVSVPSNSISWDIAERIRNKYMPPKKPTAPTAPRLIKVIKKEKPAEAAIMEAAEPVPAAQPVAAQAHAEAPQVQEEPLPADENKQRIRILKPQPHAEKAEAKPTALAEDAAAPAPQTEEVTAPGETLPESEESQVAAQTTTQEQQIPAPAVKPPATEKRPETPA